MSKILLLEDDVSLVDGLEYSLKKEGFDITIVRTVEEAIGVLPVAYVKTTIYSIIYF